MGRLDDIIERNKNPKTSFRKPADRAKGAAKPESAPASDEAVKRAAEVVAEAEGEKAPGARLDKIIARNRNPNAGFKWLKVGLAGLVLFVVLILLIFTDLATPPEDHRDLAPPAAKPSGVDGVKLWRQPVKKTGSAAPR